MNESKPIHILCIEDETDQAALTREALERAGYVLDISFEADQAIAMYAAHAYDVVMVDHSSAAIDSLQVARALTAQESVPAIIMVTHTGSERIAAEALALGVAGYIVKDPEGRYLGLLPAVIESALEQKHLAREKQQAQELLLEAEREQQRLAETLHNVASTLNSSLQLRQVLETILEQLGQVVDYDSASVMLLFEDRLEIVARQGFQRDRTQFLPLYIETLPHVQTILERRSPLTIPDTSLDRRWQIFSGSEYIRSWMGVPLVVQDQVIGLLNLNRKQPAAFNDTQAGIAMAFAHQAAVAIQNARLYEQAQQEIAERKRAETTLKEERAQAIRARDEFLAAMSHELRTPLNAILGMTEALLEDIYGPLNQTQQKALHTVEKSGRHLLELIDNILDFTRIGAGKLALQPVPVSIKALCQASIRLIQNLAQEKQIEIVFSIDTNISTIEADERRLKQILVSLLSNAIKFTPEKGTIGLEVEGDREGNQVHLTVWDKGIGIAEEDIGRIFQSFVQLDSRLARRYPGTGLGLALAHRLAEVQGGNISVESQIGQGSRFTVSLPWRGNDKDSGSHLESTQVGPSPVDP